MKRQRLILVICIIVIFAATFVLAVSEESKINCESDKDCACGVWKSNGNCAVGNKDFIDASPSKQCPDYCSGFTGVFLTKCVNKKCSIVDPSRSLCSEKEDCKVLLNKCVCEYECVRTDENYIERVCNKYECPPEVSKNINISCGCDNEVCVENQLYNSEENKTQNKTFQLSNGRKAEIKIMPETASEKAIERLGELNFTVQLKEVGKDKVVYELKAEKEGKVFGLFRAKGKIQALVNAETGEVVKIKKPWWAFLASGI